MNLDHFTAIMTLLGLVIGLLGSLITFTWRFRGTLDRLDATDRRILDMIDTDTKARAEQHRANQERFRAIERRLDWSAPPRPDFAHE